MSLKLVTWNINSVRLRIGLVAKLVNERRPDILCLQEIKCHNDVFPAEAFKSIGFPHIAVNGQKGYHGTAIVSRHPFELDSKLDLDGSKEARHVSVKMDLGPSKGAPITIHNFYVPAGGDEPNTETNPKFAQKLGYLDQMSELFLDFGRQRDSRAIIVGDLNVAPLETDVWSHKQLLKVVSHTPVEVDKLLAAQRSGQFVDAMRKFVPEEEKLFTWWSYRARDWKVSNRGRRLDHVWVSPSLGDRVKAMAVFDEARSWEKPSDHAPVEIIFE